MVLFSHIIFRIIGNILENPSGASRNTETLHHARNDGALHALKYGSARNTAAGEGAIAKKADRKYNK